MTVEATMAEPHRPHSAGAMGRAIDGKSPWDSLSTLPIRPTRRHAAYCVLFVGLFFLASDHASVEKYMHSPLQRLRQLSHNCASLHDKTTLLSAEEAEMFPMPPLNLPRQGRSNEHYREPSHIHLCKEYVARSDALRAQGTDEDRAALRQHFLEQPVHVREQDRTCNHWAAPHWALMEIFSSSIVGTAGEEVGVTYSHDCHRFMGLGDDKGITQATSRRRRLEEEEPTEGVVLDVPMVNNADDSDNDGRPQMFNTQEDTGAATKTTIVDHTTIQQILPSGPNLMWNGDKLTDQDVLSLCRGCLHGFDPSRENAQDKARVTHHCMLFPGVPEVINPPKTASMDGGLERAPCAPGSDGCEDDKDGAVKATPLEAALALIRNRVWSAAVDFAERSHFPVHAPREGVVVYIDGNSIGIAPHMYIQHLPPRELVSSLHVLVSPSCLHSHMPPRDESCRAYVERVTAYLKTVYTPQFTDVQLRYAASTAAAISRMVLSKASICPPFTLHCIMASLCKQTSKETIMFELDKEMYDALEGNVSPISHWISRAGGKSGNIKVVPVSEGELFSDTLGSEGGLGTIGAGGEEELQTEGTLVFSEEGSSGMQMVQSISQRWSNQEDYLFDTPTERMRRPEPRSINGEPLVDTSELAKEGGGGRVQDRGDGSAQTQGEGSNGDSMPRSPDDYLVTFDDEDEGGASSNAAPPRESRTSDGGIAVGQSGQSAAAGMQTSGGGGGSVVIPPSEDGDDDPSAGQQPPERPVEAGGGQTWTGPQRSQARPLDVEGSGADSFKLPDSDDEGEGGDGDASDLRFSSATPESGGSSNQQDGQRDVDQAHTGGALETNEEGKPVFQKVQGAPGSEGGGVQPGQDAGAGSTNNFAGGGGGRFGGRRNLDNPTLRGKTMGPKEDKAGGGEVPPVGKGPGRSIREQSLKDATAAAKP